ncbi:MAG: S-adenosylmethionine:tRNA ribosyltransferase-isomerase [Bacteroides sp.]|nr:S-adenosylmethionine:tRNA ribosyltransferase-isomerase [Bacteroides sp.]
MNLREVTIDEFDYPLPDERIARHPLAERDSCLLLVRDGDGTLTTRRFTDLPGLLDKETMLVYNNTRVINARLRFRKGEDRQGALIEVFCLEPASPTDYALNFASTGPVEWTCFVGNSKRWKEGTLSLPVSVDGKEVILSAERVGREGNTSVVRFSWEAPGVTFARLIEAAGELPIPPYLNRATEESDTTDYQTVFSHIDGSVAAPTAGLHFTPAVLDAIDARGAVRREVTLHVGAGTFQPVKSDTLGEHEMHSEFISVSRSLIAELATTERSITAVGTTSVRTLESLYHIGCLISAGTFSGEMPQWYPYDENHPRLSRKEAMAAILGHLDAEGADTLVGTTRLMIGPGYEFKVVDGIITNFHQPRSTLLLLVSAFLGGGGEWRRVYDYALDGEFRFLSYGDACYFQKPKS